MKSEDNFRMVAIFLLRFTSRIELVLFAIHFHFVVSRKACYVLQLQNLTFRHVLKGIFKL